MTNVSGGGPRSPDATRSGRERRSHLRNRHHVFFAYHVGTSRKQQQSLSGLGCCLAPPVIVLFFLGLHYPECRFRSQPSAILYRVAFDVHHKHYTFLQGGALHGTDGNSHDPGIGSRNPGSKNLVQGILIALYLLNLIVLLNDAKIPSFN